MRRFHFYSDQGRAALPIYLMAGLLTLLCQDCVRIIAIIFLLVKINTPLRFYPPIPLCSLVTTLSLPCYKVFQCLCFIFDSPGSCSRPSPSCRLAQPDKPTIIRLKNAMRKSRLILVVMFILFPFVCFLSRGAGRQQWQYD